MSANSRQNSKQRTAAEARLDAAHSRLANATMALSRVVSGPIQTPAPVPAVSRLDATTLSILRAASLVLLDPEATQDARRVLAIELRKLIREV